MSLRRTESTIISGAGSNINEEVQDCDKSYRSYQWCQEKQMSHLKRLWHFSSPVNFLQTRMRSNPVGLDVRFLVGLFVYFHTLCVQSAKALAMRRFARVFVIPSHELAQMKMYKVYTIRHKKGSIHLALLKPYRLNAGLGNSQKRTSRNIPQHSYLVFHAGDTK